MRRMTLPADETLRALPALHRSGGADAVTLLTVLIVVRLVLPSQLVIGPLGGAGAPATLIGLLLLAYWVWHRLHRVVPEKPALVNGAAIAFGAVALASYGVAAVRPIAADEFNLSALSLLSLAGWMGGLLLASDGVTSSDRLRALVSRLGVMGGAFAGFGLVQFVTGTAWVDRLSIPGLVANTPVYSLSQRGGFSRPFATAIHPIEFGSVIAMLLPLTIVLGLLGPVRGGGRWRNWIPAALTVLAASLSTSRSTLVGLAIGLALLWPALTALQRLVGAVATVILGVFVFVTVPGMVGTISGLFGGVATVDSSVASRIDSYGIAASYFSRAPIIGRGFGTFLPRYRIFDNQYLLGLVETGVVGVIAMVLLWLVPVVGIARVMRRTEPASPQRLLGAGLLSSCVVGGVGLAFFDGFGFPMMPAVWFVILGLGGAYIRLAKATSA
jgi:O-antigen ligase